MGNVIRVLQVTHDLEVGGLQRLVAEIALGLNPDRFAVSICALRAGGPFEKLLLGGRIKVIKVADDSSKVDYFTFLKIAKILRKEKPHIIHTHNTQPLLEGIPAAILAGTPVRVHTDHGRRFPDKKRYMIGERILSRWVDQIVTVSQYGREALCHYEKFIPKRIKVIPNGIEPEDYKVNRLKKDIREELKIGPRFGPVMGFVGRLAEEKGLIYLIRAMKKLSETLPETILLVVGEGELGVMLQEEVVRLGLDENIRFLGTRFDIPDLLSIMDIFVLPSLREGMPLAILEAMAVSLPIVATKVGGVREIVVDGVNGLMVPSSNDEALYDALHHLCKNEEKRKTFGENSRRIVSENFSKTKMLENYSGVYTDCLEIKGIG